VRSFSPCTAEKALASALRRKKKGTSDRPPQRDKGIPGWPPRGGKKRVFVRNVVVCGKKKRKNSIYLPPWGKKNRPMDRCLPKISKGRASEGGGKKVRPWETTALPKKAGAREPGKESILYYFFQEKSLSPSAKGGYARVVPIGKKKTVFSSDASEKRRKP